MKGQMLGNESQTNKLNLFIQRSQLMDLEFLSYRKTRLNKTIYRCDNIEKYIDANIGPYIKRN